MHRKADLGYSGSAGTKGSLRAASGRSDPSREHCEIVGEHSCKRRFRIQPAEVYGEVKVRENFEETQRLRRESTQMAHPVLNGLDKKRGVMLFAATLRWWARDERYFMDQSKVSRNQA